MIRLIIGVVILVLLGVLFALNGRNTATVNLFGYEAKEVPVIAVAIVSFVLGVLYSLVLYLLRFIDRRRKAGLRSREQELKDLKSSRSAAPGSAGTPGGEPAPGGPADVAPGAATSRPRRGFRRQRG
jgi:uncharacterized integral membrane protein